MRSLKKRCPSEEGPGVWGCPPNLKIPQDWGIKGVDVDYFSNLIIIHPRRWRAYADK
jgi:hypothetical protein